MDRLGYKTLFPSSMHCRANPTHKLLPVLTLSTWGSPVGEAGRRVRYVRVPEELLWALAEGKVKLGRLRLRLTRYRIILPEHLRRCGWEAGGSSEAQAR